MPLPRSGSYATQHGLLDGADGALREVGVAPGHLLLDVPEIHQLLELPLQLGAVVGGFGALTFGAGAAGVCWSADLSFLLFLFFLGLSSTLAAGMALELFPWDMAAGLI